MIHFKKVPKLTVHLAYFMLMFSSGRHWLSSFSCPQPWGCECWGESREVPRAPTILWWVSRQGLGRCVATKQPLVPDSRFELRAGLPLALNPWSQSCPASSVSEPHQSPRLVWGWAHSGGLSGLQDEDGSTQAGRQRALPLETASIQSPALSSHWATNKFLSESDWFLQCPGFREAAHGGESGRSVGLEDPAASLLICSLGGLQKNICDLAGKKTLKWHCIYLTVVFWRCSGSPL